MAGGTDLLLLIKQEKLSPGYVISVMKIPALGLIEENGGLRIGATAKLRHVREHCAGTQKYKALFEAISVLGKPQVWNMGTIGGNLCNASPAADTAPPLLVFNAQVNLRGKKGERTLALEDFFKGVNTTAMAPDEIMTGLKLDPVTDTSGSAFLKLARVGADISKISCAVAVACEGDVCSLCRIAFGAVAPVPMRIKGAEKILTGQRIEDALVERAGQMVAEAIQPINDVRSTAAYRRTVASVLFRDTFWKAWRRASGEEP
jgi:CO/xanthine dehydrogenase FAD-binding subunit